MNCEQCKARPGTHRVGVGLLLSKLTGQEIAVKVVCLVCLHLGVTFKVNPDTWEIEKP